MTPVDTFKVITGKPLWCVQLSIMLFTVAGKTISLWSSMACFKKSSEKQIFVIKIFLGSNLLKETT